MESDKDPGEVIWNIGKKLLNYQPKFPLEDLFSPAEKEKLRTVWINLIKNKLTFDYSKSREENIRMLERIESLIDEPINESLL